MTRISRIHTSQTLPLASYSLRELKFSSSQPTLSYRVGAACYPACDIPEVTYKQSEYAPCNPFNPREKIREAYSCERILSEKDVEVVRPIRKINTFVRNNIISYAKQKHYIVQGDWMCYGGS